MFSNTIVVGGAVLAAVLGSVALLGQSTPGALGPSTGLEFPVIMRQNVAAGSTPVGTKVQAKLAFATLVGRVVVPQDAVLSGEVTESIAKSANDSSRLGIRMDFAQWKNGSVPIKVYLTAWFYPIALPTNQDPTAYEQPDGGIPVPRSRRGSRTYPYPNSPASQPIPGRGAQTDPAPPASSLEPNISKHRVLMKNVESTRNDDGAILLISKHSNIKLDKATTYVLAASEPLPAN